MIGGFLLFAIGFFIFFAFRGKFGFVALAFALCGLLCIIWSSLAEKNKKKERKKQRIDYYSKLQNGTLYSEVASVFGVGTVTDELHTEYNTTQKTIEWAIGKKASIIMVFEDDKLISKMQSGLM